MEKNLPIRFFEKRRTTDEARKHGGGSNVIPSFVLSEELLEKRSAELVASFDEVTKQMQTDADDTGIPSVVNLKLNPRVRAKSHREDIADLFSIGNHNRILSMPDSTSMRVRVDSTSDAQLVRNRLEDTRNNAVGLSGIVGLETFSPYLEIDERDSSFKITLLEFNEVRLDTYIRESFKRLCNLNEIRLDEFDYGEGRMRYRVTKEELEQLNWIKTWKGLDSIVPMPIFSISLDEVSGEEVAISRKFDGQKTYATVGILDSGVAPIEQLRDWLLPEEFKSYPEQDIDRAHGTAVATILLHGDELEGEQYVQTDGCRIYSAAVFPKDGRIEEAELIQNVRNAINSRRDIKIWSMSLGSKSEADILKFSDAGKALDSIQSFYQVLIVKSIGNCRNFRANLPPSRLSVTADSLRSLVIGSIAHKASSSDIAKVGEVSPFSRRGRAPAFLVKPDLIHFGGNAGQASATGVRTLGIDGRPRLVVGTSFSTPRVTAIVANFEQILSEDFDPTLYKCLLLHGAQYPFHSHEEGFERMDAYGYGMPRSANDVLYNDQDEITLVLRDTLASGEIIDILDFPYPNSLENDGKYYGDITVTLVTDPVLFPGNGEEYCQSRIDVALGTYERITRVEPSRHYPKGYKVLGRKNLLTPEVFSSRLEQAAGFRPGAVNVNYGDTFHPIKKYGVNLEYLSDSNAQNHLSVPKKWYLKLTPLFRGMAEALAKETGSILSIPFCCIVTIRDPRKTGVVYNEVVRALEQNNFVHNTVKLKSQNVIEVRAGSQV
jgi:hypothetical protein